MSRSSVPCRSPDGLSGSLVDIRPEINPVRVECQGEHNAHYCEANISGFADADRRAALRNLSGVHRGCILGLVPGILKLISGLVDFGLKNRWLVLGGVLVLAAWGIISFRALPIEAYPDVANNYVQIITQWPGRSAEEIERQVTVPIEIQMAGIPNLAHLRSTTLAGLSSLMLIFDDGTTSDVNREHVVERLGQVSLPGNLTPQMGTDWSPVGQIYWYTVESTNPSYDVMEKKSLEDWLLEKSFKGVKGVVDVSSFGGPTKEYQIKLDPEKLVMYGLNLGQIEQQIANNNTNGGGSFIEQGAQQINVQSRGLFTSVQDIEETVVKAQNGASIKIKDIATVSQGAKIRLGQIGRAMHITDSSGTSKIV